MADIEDRAGKWADDWAADPLNDCPGRSDRDDLIAAYLAGSAQTQADYSAHYSGACDCACSNCSGCLGSLPR